MKTVAIAVTLSLCCAFAFGAHIDHSNKIVGGQNALVGEFPYIVSLRDNSSTHLCSGTILNKRTIITAAHCMKFFITKIVTGSTTIDNGGTTYSLSELKIHPEYHYWTRENDVALIILKTEIRFNDYVQPLPLPSENIADNVRVTVCGWGYTNLTGPISNDLQWIELQTITKYRCERFELGVFDTQICAMTGVGAGVCGYDTGSPLVANDKLELVGIALANPSCGDGTPDFFTRVHSFKSWIEENAVN